MILRVYDPSECDAHGVPLDWERCRSCSGGGRARHMEPVPLAGARQPRIALKPGLHDCGPCHACGGHGSLKAAALYGRRCFAASLPEGTIGATALLATTARCEDCGHPMSDGTWEHLGVSVKLTDATRAWWTQDALQRGLDTPGPRDAPTHYSPCDEGCRHGGPGRVLNVSARVGSPEWLHVLDLSEWKRKSEASWRAVDVRTLGWPHDLRPEKLAVLCLRCFAERTRSTS